LDLTGNPMVGRRVFLRPVLADDFFFMNQVATHPQTGAMWRWRGAPRNADPSQAMWSNALASFVVTSRKTGEPVALVSAVNADQLSRTCTVNYAVRPELKSAGWHLEGTVLFMNYLFRVWEMRKVYGEFLGQSIGVWQWGINRGIVKEEGRLREHVLLDGVFHDLVLVALYRQDWLDISARLMQRIVGSDGRFFDPAEYDKDSKHG
jgi:RimJ/RimL family protein N-acetyltransferase